MMPSYFYISKCSQAAVFSLSGSELYGTQLRARTFQMRTSRRLNGVDSVTVPVTGSLDQSQSHSQENSRLKRRDDVSLAADRPQSSAGFNTGGCLPAPPPRHGDTRRKGNRRNAIKEKEL